MRNAVENALYYAARKSEQNMSAALDACTHDFVLRTPAFNSLLSGRDEVLSGMAFFFALFPDYFVEAEETLSNDRSVIMVGHVKLTPDFSTLGFNGKGAPARIDFCARFDVEGALLCRETFLIDLPELCQQSSLSLPHMLDITQRQQLMSAGGQKQ